MKYLPIQINQEWHLRVENTMPIRSVNSRLYDKIEKEAIANAKPIINHDGREGYDSTEIDDISQVKKVTLVKLINAGFLDIRAEFTSEWVEAPSEAIAVFKSAECIAVMGEIDTRQVWKYISEKPVEKTPLFIATNINISDYENGIEAERTRIIGIIKGLKKSPVNGSNRILNAVYDDLLTKIKNNGK